MSDTAPTPDDTTDDAAEVEVAETTATDEPTDAHPGREAAKYRRQLRDAEATRDTLAARVQRFQTAEAERVAAGPGRLLDPTDLWRVTDLADVVDDDGELDLEKVSDAVDKLIERKPHYAEPQTSLDLDLGPRGAVQSKPAVSWRDVIGPAGG